MSSAKLIIISSPSGAGKTSISRALVEQDSNFRLSISATTRPKRAGEIEAVDYFFKTKHEFSHMIKAHEFLEYADVFGNFYGTPKDYIAYQLVLNVNVVLDIDWQGAQTIRQHKQYDTLGIYILPPSLAILRKRLIARGMDSEAVILERMHKAKLEISHYHEYDHVVINADFNKTLNEIHAVATGALEPTPAHHFADFVQDLLAQEV